MRFDLFIECIDNNTELRMHGAVLAGCSDWYKSEIEIGDIPAESSVSRDKDKDTKSAEEALRNAKAQKEKAGV